MTTAETFRSRPDDSRSASSPCFYRCGRRASVVTGSRGVCAACYSRARSAAANRPGARPQDRRE